MENQEMVLKIKYFNEKKDMRKIYKAIATAPEFQYEKGPVLVVDVEMPVELDYVELKSKDGLCRVILTRIGLQDDDVIKIVTGRDKSYTSYYGDLPSEFHSFLYTTRNVAYWYGFAWKIAESMNTRCPQIMVHKCQNGLSGCCYSTTEDYGRTTHIEIDDNPDRFYIDMIYTLAHEMRHCWQHDTNAKKYNRYKSIVDTVLHKNIDNRACHSENLIEPAIRNGELCKIGYPESGRMCQKET